MESTNITYMQIVELADEASVAGDLVQYAICRRALCDTAEDFAEELAYSTELGSAWAEARFAGPAAAMSQDEARAECARVIEESNR